MISATRARPDPNTEWPDVPLDQHRHTMPHHEESAATDDEFDYSPSKTQLKKQMHDLQSLGKELMELPLDRLEALKLPESLHDAILELRRTRSHEGRRRQLQYVGKLMRGVDPAPLREAVASYRLPGAKETLALHQAERWRDRLVDNDVALTEWLDQHPGSDAQALRTLIRNARKDAAQAAAAQPFEGAAERKGRAYRDLFQLIRQTLQEAAQAAGEDNTEDDNQDD